MKKFTVMPKFRYLIQNRTSLIAIGSLLAILLSACGSAAPTEAVPAQVATDVAATLTAQPTATPTETPTLTPTPTTTPTATVTPTPAIPVSGLSSASSCNNSQFLRDVSIPDGTVLSPGETFVKTWRFRNTGTCNWSSNYSLVFVGGRRMGGGDFEIGQTVDVNQRIDISVTLTAPDRTGTFTGSWQLADAFGNTFGDTVDVQIVVQAPVVAPPPTATPIPPTAIPPTPTAVPTHTPRPTHTPSP